MASLLPAAGEIAIGNGSIAWTTDTIKVALASSSYTPSSSHVFMSDVTNELSGGGYARVTLGSKTANDNTGALRREYVAASAVFASLGVAAGTPRYAVVFKDAGGADSANPIIVIIDLTLGGTPPSPNGQNYTITWDSTYGVFSRGYFADAFTGADSITTPPGGWVTPAGSGATRVSGNQLIAAAQTNDGFGTARASAVYDAGVTAGSIEATLVDKTLGTGEIHMYARYQDVDHQMLAVLRTGTGIVDLYKINSSGSATNLVHTTGITFTNGDVWKFEVTSGDVLTLYQNGTSRATATNNGYNTQTKFGLGCSGSCIWDSVVIRDGSGTTILNDTFATNGASGLGSSYDIERGAWGRASNQAAVKITAPTTVDLNVAAHTSPAADVAVTATLATKDSVAAGLVFRVQDATNYLVANFEASAIVLYKIVANSATSLASFSGTVSNGDAMRVVCHGTTINIYQNGTQRISTTSSQFQTAVGHGLRSNGTTARIDDFRIDDAFTFGTAVASTIFTASAGTFSPGVGNTLVEWLEAASLIWTPVDNGGNPISSGSITMAFNGASVTPTVSSLLGGAYLVSGAAPFTGDTLMTVTSTATTSDATVNSISWTFTPRGAYEGPSVAELQLTDYSWHSSIADLAVVGQTDTPALAQLAVLGFGHDYFFPSLAEMAVLPAVDASVYTASLAQLFITKSYNLPGLDLTANIGVGALSDYDLSVNIHGTNAEPYSLTLNVHRPDNTDIYVLGVDIAQPNETTFALTVNIGIGAQSEYNLTLDAAGAYALLLLLAWLRCEPYAIEEDGA